MVSNIVVYLYCNQITIIMDLKVAEKLALELMEKNGLNSMVWNFRWDNSKKRFGVCINNRIGGRFGTYVGGTIGLSRALVSINEVEKVTDTILHEIAHALTPGHGHDSVWRRKALEIGSNGNRCFSSEEANIPEMRYQAVCGGCEKVFQKTRMTRTSLNRKESCKCQSGKSWDNRHLLVYKDTKATS